MALQGLSLLPYPIGSDPLLIALGLPQHYCGRGLMKRFETGAELAKEMGLSEAKLAQTFADYVKVTKNPKLDPFGKKL